MLSYEEKRRLLSDIEAASFAARETAHSARQSERYLEDVVDLTGYSSGALGELLAVSERYLPQIVAALGDANGFLDRVAGALSAPAETGALEKARWGMRNMQRLYFEEATQNFTASLKEYPYDASVHLALGMCWSREGERAKALKSFQAAARYAKGEDEQTIVDATVLAANATDSSTTKKKLLTEALEQVPDAPDLWLTLATVTQDVEHLVRALELEPSLLATARAARLPVELAVATIAPMIEDEIERASTLVRQATERLANAAVSIPAAPKSFRGSADAVSALESRIAYSIELREYVQALVHCAEQPLATRPDPARPVPPTAPRDLWSSVALALVFGWLPGVLIAAALTRTFATILVVWAALVLGAASVAIVKQTEAAMAGSEFAAASEEYEQALATRRERMRDWAQAVIDARSFLSEALGVLTRPEQLRVRAFEVQPAPVPRVGLPL